MFNRWLIFERNTPRCSVSIAPSLANLSRLPRLVGGASFPIKVDRYRGMRWRSPQSGTQQLKVSSNAATQSRPMIVFENILLAASSMRPQIAQAIQHPSNCPNEKSFTSLRLTTTVQLLQMCKCTFIEEMKAFSFSPSLPSFLTNSTVPIQFHNY